MDIRLLKYISCPYDDSQEWDLVSTTPEDSSIKEVICRKCKRVYPCIDGILSIMPDNFYKDTGAVSKLKRIEQKVRDEGAENYLKWFGPYTHDLEYKLLLQKLCPQQNESLLDVGCGIGRITVPLGSRFREIVAVDYSMGSLLLLRKKLEEEQIHNVLLLQADATMLPFKEAVFDKAVSSQVITFIPTKEQRLVVQGKIHRSLRTGAIFVFTVFNNHLYRQWKHRKGIRGVFAKEGTHPDLGFYYYNYSFTELKKEILCLPYKGLEMYGVCNFPREKLIDKTINRSIKIAFLLDRLISLTFISALFGDLILTKVVKRFR